MSIEDVYHGATKGITLESFEPDAHGRPQQARRSYQIKIPPGVKDGSRIRLSGQGGAGRDGGSAGDLYIRLHIASHPQYTLDGFDLHVTLPVTPWEAALGARVETPTPDGQVRLTIPAGTQSGRSLRLKGKGLRKKADERGDLYAHINIMVPEDLTDGERQLFKDQSKASSFNPRKR